MEEKNTGRWKQKKTESNLKKKKKKKTLFHVQTQ